ncbi:MAG: DUF3747 domain-containing protein, partial [Synechococcales cyanobacterium RU_4_20]|nr:DUF3747 domain-containing protein [Synechococcales cyanobacterium RU_4_20]
SDWVEQQGFAASQVEVYPSESQSRESPPPESQSLHPDEEVVLMAAPVGDGSHQLVLVEQRPGSCRSAAPTTLNPLLLGFNFGGTCDRTIDGDRYSVRTGGEELNWRYGLAIVEYGRELLLLGIPTDNPAEAKLLIARSRGGRRSAGARVPLRLETGWRLTQRTYNGNILEQLYLAQDSLLTEIEVKV